MRKQALAAAAGCMLLQACAAQLEGPPRIIETSGIVGDGKGTAVEVVEKTERVEAGNARNIVTTRRTTTTNLNFRDRFKHFATLAAASPTQTAALGEMRSSGFLLVRTNCDGFFREMAILQRDSDVGRDMIAPILTALTGIVALANLSSSKADDYLEGFSLASGAALAGISTIDAHFLFGADNIHEVRELTFRALAAHEEALTDMGAAHFDDVVTQLVEHQVVCSPANILRLTKDAIQAGDVVADTTGSRSEDEEALSELASQLDLMGSARTSQAAALWALYKGGISGTAVPDTLVQELGKVQLGHLVTSGSGGAAAQLSETGSAKREEITEILDSFSKGTRDALQEQAEALLQGRTEIVSQPIRLGSSPGSKKKVNLIVR
ncbi:MAG TPA: hypothetical protein VGD10_09210 [Allosphingosinicella sp.]|uniref:hypothetical protein n=1 Tax=Allosphingosinicella sp. TaxID=2823234 RepID=UPI002EDA2374